MLLGVLGHRWGKQQVSICTQVSWNRKGETTDENKYLQDYSNHCAVSNALVFEERPFNFRWGNLKTFHFD